MRSEYTKLHELVAKSASVLSRGYRFNSPEPDEHRAGKSTVEAKKGSATEPPTQSRPAAAVVERIAAKPIERANLAALVSKETSGAIEELSAMVRDCRLCKLCETRKKAVPGSGSLTPAVMVIGEGPGADEDRLGLPFVGAAGQYLDKWLDAISLSRYRNAYIANVVKCRPPSNRDPEPEEIEACTPYLDAQIDILKPKAILVVGRIAASYLLGRDVRMNEVRGKVFEYRGVRFMPTYHPSAVLRSPDLKRAVWEDLKYFKQELMEGLPAQ